MSDDRSGSERRTPLSIQVIDEEIQLLKRSSSINRVHSLSNLLSVTNCHLVNTYSLVFNPDPNTRVFKNDSEIHMCNTWYIFLVDTYKDIMYARNQLYLDRKVSLVVAPFVCLRVRVPLHHVLFISCSLQLPLDVQSLMAKHHLVTYVVTEGQASFALDSFTANNRD